MEFVQTAGTVRGPNITMHKTNGIGNWKKETFVKRFKRYSDNTFKLEEFKPTDRNTLMM